MNILGTIISFFCVNVAKQHKMLLFWELTSRFLALVSQNYGLKLRFWIIYILKLQNLSANTLIVTLVLVPSALLGPSNSNIAGA